MCEEKSISPPKGLEGGGEGQSLGEMSPKKVDFF